MFPVCDTREGYEAQLKRRRIRGVVPQAAAIIERLQPYRRRDLGRDYRLHPLWVLNALENIDKHRRLALTTNVGVGGMAEMLIDGQLVRTVRKGRFRNGAIFASFDAPASGQPKMRVQGYMTVAVAFDERTVFDDDVPALDVVGRIIEYTRIAAVNELAPFVSNGS